MSWVSEEQASNIFDLKSGTGSPQPRVRLTFTTCDVIETKKREVISRGLTPMMYSFDLHAPGSTTPVSQVRKSQVISPFFGTLTKRNANSPLSPSTWQKINSNIKRPRYDDTPVDFGFGRRGDKKSADGLLNLREMDFAPLPATQLFKKPYLNFEKYDNENLPRSHAKAGTHVLHSHGKASISKTSIVDAKEAVVGEKTGCNCRNSKCLKLYCECLRQGGFCGPSCNCFDCENHGLSEVRREKIRNIEKKNPLAFKPIIVAQRDVPASKVHNKGCNCRKSNCLKNYCECHQFGVKCGEHCKCVSCKNTEDCADAKAIGNANTRSELYERESGLVSTSFD